MEVVLNGTISLISLGARLPLVYKKAADLCVLNLYPATFLNKLMCCRKFLIKSLVFFMYIIISFAYENTLTSSFLIYILFFLSFNSISVRLPVLYQRGDGKVDSCILFFMLVESSALSKTFTSYIFLSGFKNHCKRECGEIVISRASR